MAKRSEAKRLIMSTITIIGSTDRRLYKIRQRYKAVPVRNYLSRQNDLPVQTSIYRSINNNNNNNKKQLHSSIEIEFIINNLKKKAY